MHLIKIIDGLYTRGKLSLGTPPASLERLGIDSVISLIPPGEPSLVEWPGYLHWPMSDGGRVDEELLYGAVDVVLYNLQHSLATLVMCRAGRNRTGLVVCTVLREWLGISGKESLSMFRAKRPRGVANPAFEQYLLSLPSKAG